jgi:hypothetical protein
MIVVRKKLPFLLRSSFVSVTSLSSQSSIELPMIILLPVLLIRGSSNLAWIVV